MTVAINGTASGCDDVVVQSTLLADCADCLLDVVQNAAQEFVAVLLLLSTKQ